MADLQEWSLLSSSISMLEEVDLLAFEDLEQAFDDDDADLRQVPWGAAPSVTRNCLSPLSNAGAGAPSRPRGLFSAANAGGTPLSPAGLPHARLCPWAPPS